MGSVRDEISKNLLYYRKKKGYTQIQLAKFLGVKNSSVSNWEKGRNSIDIETLVLACKILEVSISDMYGIYAGTSALQNEESNEVIRLFKYLDKYDQGIIIGEIKQMLRADKYLDKAKKQA